jgi:hypothetical protein
MNKNVLPPFVGVFVSWLVIWQLHEFLLVDGCLDKGGSFDYKTGQCLLDTVNTQASGLSSGMLVLYFAVGIIVALLVASVVRKLIYKK